MHIHSFVSSKFCFFNLWHHHPDLHGVDYSYMYKCRQDCVLESICIIYSLLKIILIVTQHEEIGLMYTKYTFSHYFNYLTFHASYRSSVNYIKFPIAYYHSFKSFIAKAQSLGTKLWNFKVHKSGQINFYVHISPIFSCRVTIIAS